MNCYTETRGIMSSQKHIRGSSFVSPISTPFGSCSGYRITSIT